MDERREQAFVGLFVLIAATLLLVAIFTLSGLFSSSKITYHAEFPFAGGLEEGSPVRYAGGPKAGRVEKVHIDPKNPALTDVTFSVQPGVPVKTDSHVKIASLSPLGDNHLEILPGSSGSAPAPIGSLLKADPYVSISDLTDQLNALAPDAQKLLVSLNERTSELKTTINRVNDLLSDENRANLSGTLAGTRGMIAENRAQLKTTIQNLNVASQRLEPLLQNLQNTSDEANKTLNHVDAVIGQNAPDIHQAILQMREAVATINQLALGLNQTLETNSGNIDQTLDNIRQSTQNLNDFTDDIKNRPSALIRSSSARDHKPGGSQ
jgi:phospholipid/cholesterol/gamma-HCH transport system substrate-binding protein